MKKIVGVFPIMEQAEKALRDLEATGLKPNHIVVYSDEKFDAVERDVGLPVSFMPSFSSFVGFNSTPIANFVPNSIYSAEAEITDAAIFGKVAVEVTSSEDDLTLIGGILRNHGACDVKQI